ncbi:MAG: RNA polymerase sigma factor [Calditrichaeota bacterium]|nr:RNA polymerase sigma factor [Calditrichota bacterium]MCB9391382.1 RNA polymerase sigma factor [Calditrichota bacterium]
MQHFEAIYQKYAPDLYRFAYSLTLDADAAKDIAAETFARALLVYDPKRQPTVRSFLFSIAHKLTIDHLRRRGRSEDLDPDTLSLAPLFEDQTEHRDELLATLLHLRTFPELDRDAILLRAQGLGYDEISAALGVSVAACKVRVHRARLKLAEWRAKNLEEHS